MHLFPQLRKLEAKYGERLVVIGVHSPKFDAERDLHVVRDAVRRYEIEHPVVNDADHAIWRSYGIRAWPSLLFIDPEGRAVGRHEGELPFEIADRLVGEMLAEYESLGLLDEAPLEIGRPEPPPESPLSYPGKLIVDEPSERLFVTDTNHNRILECGLDGAVRRRFSSGSAALDDGPAADAAFDHPQGIVLAPEGLYVADTGNHAIRLVDMGTGHVTTVAGTGVQSLQRHRGGKALSVSLASPWDLAWHDGLLVVAMAGFHQLWAYRAATGEIGVYAGAGDEGLRDGARQSAALAQTNGITFAGDRLYFADSETSSIRVIDPDGEVRTLIGSGLFDWGDRDGVGVEARLQHPQALCWAPGGKHGVLYIADTYNNRVKRLDLDSGRCERFAGAGAAGYRDGPAAEAGFNEPAGLCATSSHLYVADTNNHAVRRIRLVTGEVETLALSGL